MKKRNIIIFIIIVAILVLGVVLIKNKGQDNEEQVEETTNKVATKKSNETFEIYNTDIKIETGSTVMTTTVKNKTENRTEEQKLIISLLDKKGNEIGTMTLLVPSLESGKLTEVVSESLTVYEGVNDFKIKKE